VLVPISSFILDTDLTAGALLDIWRLIPLNRP
jgi:hypothetical protein